MLDASHHFRVLFLLSVDQVISTQGKTNACASAAAGLRLIIHNHGDECVYGFLEALRFALEASSMEDCCF